MRTRHCHIFVSFNCSLPALILGVLAYGAELQRCTLCCVSDEGVNITKNRIFSSWNKSSLMLFQFPSSLERFTTSVTAKFFS